MGQDIFENTGIRPGSSITSGNDNLLGNPPTPIGVPQEEEDDNPFSFLEELLAASNTAIVFPDYTAIFAQQERTNNLSLLDQIWAERLEAVNSTIAEVDRRISDERSRADLLGVDFNVSEEGRAQRIGELFGTIWTDADEFRLNNLASQYGNPEQDDKTRAAIERGEIPYEFEFDVVGLTPEDRRVPRREREEKVGNSLRDTVFGQGVSFEDVDNPFGQVNSVTVLGRAT